MEVQQRYRLKCTLSSKSVLTGVYRQSVNVFGMKCSLGLQATRKTVRLYFDVKNTNDEVKSVLVKVVGHADEMKLINPKCKCKLSIEETRRVVVGAKVFRRKLLKVPRKAVTSNIDLQLVLTIREFSGDFNPRFQEKSELTDLEVLVGDNRFHVSKAILLNSSSFFRSQLLADPELTEFTVSDTDPAIFDTLLSELHGDRYLYTLIAEKVLELARRLDCPIVERRVEQFLMTTWEIDQKKISNMNWARKMELPRLEKFMGEFHENHYYAVPLGFWSRLRKESSKHFLLFLALLSLIVVSTVILPFLERLLFRSTRSLWNSVALSGQAVVNIYLSQ